MTLGIRLGGRTAMAVLLGGLVQLAAAQTEPQIGQDSTVADTPRTCDWRSLLPNTLEDQRRIFGVFPGEVAHGKHWIPVLAIAAATTGLIIADQYDTPYFRRTTSLHTFNRVFSSTNTAAATALVPGALYLGGLIAKDSYAKETALLSGEAALDAEVVDVVMKLASNRLRPISIPPRSNYADSFVEGKDRWNASFPSGHAVTGFAVATIISRRYGARHRWVTPVAYGAAAAIGLSRVTTAAHFPSDVFFGSALGYAIGRFGVLRE
jgi:PAP2 superfamily